MGIARKRLKKRCRFALSKKGVVEFVFSKFAFLVFGIIIASSFFYIVSVQKNIEHLDKMARTSDSISSIIAMTSSTPYEVWITYESKLDAKISFQNNSFTIYTDKNLTRTTYFPINLEDSETGISISCLNISNSNGTVIRACQ